MIIDVRQTISERKNEFEIRRSNASYSGRGQNLQYAREKIRLLRQRIAPLSKAACLSFVGHVQQVRSRRTPSPAALYRGTLRRLARQLMAPLSKAACLSIADLHEL